MPDINPEAKTLNDILQRHNPALFQLLSQRGKSIYFPQKGLVRQGMEARGKRINATVGMAIENGGLPMRLAAMDQCHNLDPKDVYPYISSYGKPPLREAWRNMIRQNNPSLEGTVSLPVVTSGLTHGLSMVGYLFVDSGDEIIITDKYWGNYKLIFEQACGGVLRPYTMFRNSGLDLGSLRQSLKKKTGKQIVLFSVPNNPTGYTPTDEEARQIVQIITESAEAGNQILVINDDAYFGLAYGDGVFTESLFSLLADAHENVLAVKVDGATKELYSWGLRVGFVTMSAKGMTEEVCRALEDKIAGAVRGNISSASHISQTLVLAALTSPDYQQDKEAKYQILKKRFEEAAAILKDKQDTFGEYFSPLPFNSGYFLCLKLKDGIDAETVRQILLKDFDTGVVAMQGLLRIAFSSVPKSDIPDLFDNIYRACQQTQ